MILVIGKQPVHDLHAKGMNACSYQSLSSLPSAPVGVITHPIKGVAYHAGVQVGFSVNGEHMGCCNVHVVFK